jgi:hypothetical protein
MHDSKTLSAPPELLEAIAAAAEHLGALEAQLLTLQRFQLDASAGVLVASIRGQLLTLQRFQLDASAGVLVASIRGQLLTLLAAAESLEQLDLIQLSLIVSDDMKSEDPYLLDTAFD